MSDLKTITEENPDHTDDADQCRVCFEKEGIKRQKNFLVPCLCSGSIKYIHQSCWEACGYLCNTCKFPPKRVYEKLALKFIHEGLALQVDNYENKLYRLYDQYISIPLTLFLFEIYMNHVQYFKTACRIRQVTYLWLAFSLALSIYNCKSLIYGNFKLVFNKLSQNFQSRAYVRRISVRS